MKHLLTTTAITLLTALPLQAESHAGADMTSGASVSVDDRNLSVSSLMQAKVYMPENYTMDTDEITAVPRVWDAIGTVEQVLVDENDEVAMLVVAPSDDVEAGAERVAIDAAELDLMTVRGDETQIVAVYTGGMDGFADAVAFEEASVDDMGLKPAGEATDLSEDLAATAEDIGNATAEAADDFGDATADAADAVGEAAGDAARATEEAASEMAAATEEAASDLARDIGIDPATLTAEDLDGATVYEPSGDSVGEISEIVVAQDGEIDTVVIDVGGFLGIGEKPVALSFDELEITQGQGLAELRVEIDHSQDALEAMETWNG